MDKRSDTTVKKRSRLEVEAEAKDETDKIVDLDTAQWRRIADAEKVFLLLLPLPLPRP